MSIISWIFAFLESLRIIGRWFLITGIVRSTICFLDGTWFLGGVLSGRINRIFMTLWCLRWLIITILIICWLWTNSWLLCSIIRLLNIQVLSSWISLWACITVSLTTKENIVGNHDQDLFLYIGLHWLITIVLLCHLSFRHIKFPKVIISLQPFNSYCTLSIRRLLVMWTHFYYYLLYINLN